MTPTPTIVREMGAFIKQFRQRGGSVRLPPHRTGQRQAWRAEAKRFREDFEALPPSQRTDRLKSGLDFMWFSLNQARCIVALMDSDLVAGLSYVKHPDVIEAKVVGSRQ